MLWQSRLPVARHDFNPGNPDSDAGIAITYGDYFTAAQQFLRQDNGALLCAAAGRMTSQKVTPGDIDHVAIYLVKHGAFYHPARVVVDLRDGRLSFVLNVALSRAGRKIIALEFHNLSRLNAERRRLFWPRVFGIGHGDDLRGRQTPMFLGQWLDAFYEFHLTGEDPSQRVVVVWDTEKGHRMLTRHQTMDCLRQAATILAYAYNPWTSEAVGNWHHAAGDFVIALSDSAIDLRQITIRDLAPMVEASAEPDVALMLDALLVFWVDISLKLRLDRLNGTGRMVCHGDDTVPATCEGFLKGLQWGASEHGLPDDFHATAKAYLALHRADKLMPIAAAIIDKYPPHADERDPLQRILKSHVTALESAIALEK